MPVRKTLSRALLPGLLAALLLLQACAQAPAPVDPREADAVWNAMLSSSPMAEAPFRDSLSLRFGRRGDTRRVTALFWGDGSSALRLALRAGVGVAVASISQVDGHFLLHNPTEGKASFHEGPSPMLRLGLPLPFGLPRLEALLHGRWTELFGAVHEGALAERGGLAFQLPQEPGALGGRLVLDRSGRPLRWSGQGWTMELALDEEGLPSRVELSSSAGEPALVLVQGRERPEAPFGREALRVSLPEETALLPLSDFVRRR